MKGVETGINTQNKIVKKRYFYDAVLFSWWNSKVGNEVGCSRYE